MRKSSHLPAPERLSGMTGRPRRFCAGGHGRLPRPTLASTPVTASLEGTAAGIVGMVGGQAVDLDAARPHGARAAPRTAFDLPALQDMHARKTGALIRASALAGATMGGAPHPVREAIDVFGRELGSLRGVWASGGVGFMHDLL